MRIPKSKIFLSYAHEDDDYQNQAVAHLSVLEHSGKIASWHDRMIMPGSNWKEEIDKQLRVADVIVALVSADFIASEYCSGIEMSEAISRHEKKRSILIPVVVRPVLISETPFAKFEALPPDAKPVSEWISRDEAWKTVTRGVLGAALEIERRKQAILEKLFGLQPVLDFYEERSSLISLQPDSKIARNIARLSEKNADLGERIGDYIAKLPESAETMLRAIWDAYETLFKVRGMQLMFACTMLDEPIQQLWGLCNEEVEIVGTVLKQDLKPELFGLPTQSKCMQDLNKIIQVYTSNMENITSGIGKLGGTVEELKRIGERTEGDEFEEVDND